jgi:tetratricopeptide (TPR) repeat protein
VDLAGLDQEIVEAVEAARQGVLQQPRSPEAWGKLGAVLQAHQFHSDALFCYAQAERRDPRDGRWSYLIASLLMGSDPEAALLRLRRAAELCGEENTPRLRLGEVLLDRGEVNEAEALFRAVLAKAPDDARAHLGLGQIALERNDLDGAVEHLRRAAAGAPKATIVHAALARAYRWRGDQKAAEEESRILAQLPEDFSWPDPGRKYVNQFWTGLRARMAQINSFDKAGLREEAVVAARQAAQRYPDSAVARLVLGEMLNKVKNTTASEPVLREAIRLDPNRAKAYFELGYALQANGKIREAAESYRRTIELQPDLPAAHYNRALCLVTLQDEAGGEAAFRSALRYRSEYPEALMGMAMLLGRQRKYPEAMKYAEEAGRVAPADPRPRELLKELQKKKDQEENESKKKKP